MLSPLLIEMFKKLQSLWQHIRESLDYLISEFFFFKSYIKILWTFGLKSFPIPFLSQYNTNLSTSVKVVSWFIGVFWLWFLRRYWVPLKRMFYFLLWNWCRGTKTQKPFALCGWSWAGCARTEGKEVISADWAVELGSCRISFQPFPTKVLGN